MSLSDFPGQIELHTVNGNEVRLTSQHGEFFVWLSRTGARFTSEPDARIYMENMITVLEQGESIYSD